MLASLSGLLLAADSVVMHSIKPAIPNAVMISSLYLTYLDGDPLNSGISFAGALALIPVLEGQHVLSN